jgi:hypothetical protein
MIDAIQEGDVVTVSVTDAVIMTVETAAIVDNQSYPRDHRRDDFLFVPWMVVRLHSLFV